MTDTSIKVKDEKRPYVRRCIITFEEDSVLPKVEFKGEFFLRRHVDTTYREMLRQLRIMFADLRKKESENARRQK